jgi:hypothetical protein
MPDASGHFFHHIVIVRDQQDGSGGLLKNNVQRVDRFQIQVVRWLVQQQEVRFLEHQAAENEDAPLLHPKGFGAIVSVLSTE